MPNEKSDAVNRRLAHARREYDRAAEKFIRAKASLAGAQLRLRDELLRAKGLKIGETIVKSFGEEFLLSNVEMNGVRLSNVYGRKRTKKGWHASEQFLRVSPDGLSVVGSEAPDA